MATKHIIPVVARQVHFVYDCKNQGLVLDIELFRMYNYKLSSKNLDHDLNITLTTT